MLSNVLVSSRSHESHSELQIPRQDGHMVVTIGSILNRIIEYDDRPAILIISRNVKLPFVRTVVENCEYQNRQQRLVVP